MGMTEAKIANNTGRTAELIETLLKEQQRTNQLLEQLLTRGTVGGPAPASQPMTFPRH